jgi:IS1 family transposase/transposase-like protein
MFRCVQVWGAKLPMYHSVQDVVLVVSVWVVLNQWAIWELIERERGKPIRKRRRKAQDCGEPKPFPGLAQKPVCEACEKEEQACDRGEEPPPMRGSGRGRPAAVDTSQQFCPNKGCRYYGREGRGNIVANGHPGGGPWRQFHCKACGCWFLETHGTVFFGRRAAVPLLLWVLAAVVEGLGIRAAGRVFGLDANTVESWLGVAAKQMMAFAAYVMVDLELEQVQLDEIFATLGHLLEAGVGLGEIEAGSSWLWTAMDPVSKLLLVMVVGDHTLAVAQAVVHQVKRRLAAHCLPVFLTDGLAHYKLALLTHFGRWALAGEGAIKPRWFPVAGLIYAQVIKTVRRGRLVWVKQRVVFGSLEAVRVRLGRRGWKINTAFVERLNLSIRQHVAALGRRVLTRAQSPVGLSHQAMLFLVYYNFCLVHASLRLPLDTPQATRGTGSPKRWHERTPAMAAGLTDHVWTLREVLLYRVPPRRPAQSVA